MIKDSGHREAMGDTGFVRDTHVGKGRMDLLPWYGIMEVAKHCEEGARKYGERNIDKGAPLHSLLDSGARHLAKLIAGETDEDHLRAACWNLLWALQQRTTHPELDDLPKKEAAKAEKEKSPDPGIFRIEHHYHIAQIQGEPTLGGGGLVPGMRFSGGGGNEK